jgi:hypothetical protein
MGATLCRLYPFFFYGNVGASLMNMVAITINRYVGKSFAAFLKAGSSLPYLSLTFSLPYPVWV